MTPKLVHGMTFNMPVFDMLPFVPDGFQSLGVEPECPQGREVALYQVPSSRSLQAKQGTFVPRGTRPHDNVREPFGRRPEIGGTGKFEKKIIIKTSLDTRPT